MFAQLDSDGSNSDLAESTLTEDRDVKVQNDEVPELVQEKLPDEMF